MNSVEGNPWSLLDLHMLHHQASSFLTEAWTPRKCQDKITLLTRKGGEDMIPRKLF